MAYKYEHHSKANASRTPSDQLSISKQLLNLVRRNEKNPYLIDSDRTTEKLTNAPAEADPAAAKREVQMHRKILLSDIIIGPNKNGTPESNLLVPEDGNSNKTREYIKSKGGKYFYCVGCNNNKKQNLGKIEDIYFFAPVIHAQKCLAILKQEDEGELKNNVQKPKISSTASNYVIDYCDETSALKENNESPKRSGSPSPQVLAKVKQTDTKIAINEYDVLTPSLVENRSRAKKRETEEPIHILMKQQKIVVDGFIADDYARNFSKQKNEHLVLTESPTSESIYKFNHPSTSWLRTACGKLKICFTQNAYKFWGNIDITEIKETSKPRYVQKVKSGKDSSFCGLSYLLSGEENESIKTVIKNYFYDNFRSLGIVAGYDFSTLTLETTIIKDTIIAEEMTPFLWETVAKWLGCRIGIFESNTLLKYGIWNDNDEKILTLLFKKDSCDYCIIMSLDED